MRLVFALLLVPLLIVLVVFLSTNFEEHVTVNLGTRSYPAIPLYLVVFVAFTLGATFVAVIALVEGATIRLANRRLRREINRLETENNFLRTQPSAPRPQEPDALERELPRGRFESGVQGGPAEAPPPSAPVYGTKDRGSTETE